MNPNPHPAGNSAPHRSRVRARLVGAALLALAAGCGSDGSGPVAPPAPVAGVLVARLTTPNPDDRAVLVEVTGPSITSVPPGADTSVTVHGRVVEGTLRAAVFGTVRAGTVVRFAVPDVNAAARYAGRVVEASGPASALRASLDGYRVDVARP
jgi:hypothetical protein